MHQTIVFSQKTSICVSKEHSWAVFQLFTATPRKLLCT
jgi:hypothetical protein